MNIANLALLALSALLAVGGTSGRADAVNNGRTAAVTSGAAAETPFGRQIGQLMVTGFLGRDTQHPWFRAVLGQVQRGEIGGVLYLRRNIASLSRIATMNHALRQAAADEPLPLACIDQEGGRVSRLRKADGFDDQPSARRMALSNTPQLAAEAYGRMASNLAALGFDCNLAPVVDVDVKPESPAIGAAERSFSRDPAIVADFAEAFVEAHRRHGVITALKHFPGHGSATADSHEAFADVTDSWTEEELRPYRRLLEAGHDGMIMTGHIIHRRFDERGAPASLSRAVTGNLLRQTLGWSGVVITDDLQMEPVMAHLPPERAVIAAIRAGADIVILANDTKPELDLPARIARIAEEEAARDPHFRARVEEAYRRVVDLKLRYRERTTLRDARGNR